MEFNVNGPNEVHGVNIVSVVNKVKNGEFLNTVFGNKNGGFIPGTAFEAEEQHVLGIFANVQNNILIED